MTEPAELLASLTALLASIESGEVKASAATRHRVEGAIAALDALAGSDAESIIDRLERGRL